MEIKDRWRGLVLRRAHYGGSPRRFELLYVVSDPWQMHSDAEASRFAWVDQLLEAHLKPASTILEIGCGEGHQSVHLARHCDHLFGVDASQLAIARCRRRCPRGLFKVGNPARLSFAYTPLVFDLVVACEVVYYMRDPARCIERLTCLGRACFVTYYDEQFEALDPWFEQVAEGYDTHEFGGTSWRAVWWRNHRVPTGLSAERP